MANTSAAVSDPKAADAAAKAHDARWYAFRGIGRAYLVSPGTAAAAEADESAVHGYPTIEAAIANPNTVDTASQLTISQWDLASSLPLGGGSVGVIETVNVTWSGSTATASTPQDPAAAAAGQLPGLSQIGAFFSALTDSNTWIRVTKVIIGGMLVLIGIAHMTGADNAAASTLRRVPLPS